MKCVIELTLYSFHDHWFLSLYNVISPGVYQKWPAEKDLVFLVVPWVPCGDGYKILADPPVVLAQIKELIRLLS